MKKLLSLLLITALLCGCSQNNTEASTTTTSTTSSTTTTGATSATTTTTTASATTTTPQTTTTAATTTIPEEPDIYANATDTAMPEALSYNGGDENNDYWLPCINRFDVVNSTVLNLVDDDVMNEWSDKMNANKTPYDIEDYINPYSFMVYFDLSPEEVCAAIEKDNKFLLDFADSHDGAHGFLEAVYTDEDLEVLKSGDKAKITKHFAREGSIVIGDKIFNPNWVYNHTIEDYKSFGITRDMISEKIDFYRTLNFSDKARAAFETKLEAFIDKDIEFSYVSPNV